MLVSRTIRDGHSGKTDSRHSIRLLIYISNMKENMSYSIQWGIYQGHFIFQKLHCSSKRDSILVSILCYSTAKFSFAQEEGRTANDFITTFCNLLHCGGSGEMSKTLEAATSLVDCHSILHQILKRYQLQITSSQAHSPPQLMYKEAEQVFLKIRRNSV